jgi:ribonuclease HII
MPRLTEEQDRARVQSLFDFDFDASHGGLVLGIDEVGRGPVAGPLAAGGVVFEGATYIKWLNDSKKITEKRRPIVADDIKEKSLFSTVVFVQATEIDELGIAEALKVAFKQVIFECENSSIIPSTILVDGNSLDLSDSRVKCIIKGDSNSAAIAAASVVAKVKRDNLMKELDKLFPHYEWASNKGYGTKAHLDAVKNFGLTEYHRRSFLKKYI